MAASTRTIPKEWMDETRNLKEVIPKAIVSFNEALNHKVKTEILAFLCKVLVPNLSILDLEETLLCHVFPELPAFVNKICLEIEDNIQCASVDETDANRLEILHNLLLILLSILEGIKCCLQYIHTSFNCINIYQIHSLPIPVLLIVKSAFHHCQVSEMTYGDLFSDVSQELSDIFRKSFELQKILLDVLNVRTDVLVLDSCKKDVQNIVEVCHNLLDICSIIEKIDASTTPAIWKSLIRLILKNKETIKNHIQIEKIVSQMCCTIEEKLLNYENLIKNSQKSEQIKHPEPAYLKLLKILKFLMKLLINFVQNFQDFLILPSCKYILHLMFSIIRLSYCGSVAQQTLNVRDDFRESLAIVVEPFLQIMVLNKKFADLMTYLDQEVDPRNCFACCYTLANIVVLLPVIPEEMITYWINPANYPEDEPRNSVIEALIRSSDSCFVEMSFPVLLPGKMSNGKAQRMVSLYEYVVLRLTACITAITPQHFHVVERILMRNVLSRSLACSTLSTDVWCFMARWSTADLCYYHVKLFLHWLSTVSWKNDLQRTRLRTLVRRLMPLMATEHQELFVKMCSPVSLDNMEIWSIVPLHKMIDSVQQQVSQSLVQFLNPMLHQWLNKNLSETDLVRALHFLQNFLSHRKTVDHLLADRKSELTLAVIQLFDAFLENTHLIPQSSWCSLIDIIKVLLPTMHRHDFTKVLRNISKTVGNFKDEFFNINIARIMAECGQLAFPIEQNESASISEVFRTLITSKSWLVHSESFLALRRFAEVTPYTPVLEHCVPDEQKADFQKFICAIPYNCLESDDKNILMLDILKEQASAWGKVAKPQEDVDVVSFQPGLSRKAENQIEKRRRNDAEQSDHKPKKVKTTNSMTSEDDQTLSASMDELSKHLLIIQDISSRYTSFPSDVRDKLRTVKDSFEKLVTSI